MYKSKVRVALCIRDNATLTTISEEVCRAKMCTRVISVRTATSGTGLLDLCKRGPDRLDIIVADGIMGGMNLSDVLFALVKEGIKPTYVVGILDQYMPTVMDDMGQAKVNQIYIKPDPITVVDAIGRYYSRLLYTHDLVVHPLEEDVYNILNQMGVSHGHLGYDYIRDGILLGYEDIRYIHSITKMLYPLLTDKYNQLWDRSVTISSVDRCIRSAVQYAWIHGNHELLTEMFGYSYSSDKGNPTNSEFFGGVINYLKLHRKTLSALVK